MRNSVFASIRHNDNRDEERNLFTAQRDKKIGKEGVFTNLHKLRSMERLENLI